MTEAELEHPCKGPEIRHQVSSEIGAEVDITHSLNPEDHIKFLNQIADSTRAHWQREDKEASGRETLYEHHLRRYGQNWVDKYKQTFQEVPREYELILYPNPPTGCQ